MHSFPRRHALALSLVGALACMSPAIAQQIVADGDIPGEDFKMPATGDYATVDPDQSVFHAINGGQIIGAVGTTLSTTGDNAAGVRVEGGGSSITLDHNSSILTTGRGAAGVAVTGGAFDGWEVGVETRGEHASGVQVAGGNAALTRSTVQTFGQEAHGVEATAGRFIGDAAHIRTGGHGAYGASLRDGELLMENGSAIETSGREAHGIVADGTSRIMLGQTDVLTHGEAAWGAVIGDGSQLQLDGSVVYSALHGGVRVRGSGSPGLRLDNGSFLHGGNGTALALDASVAGRFDVELNSSEIFGDIVINPDDLAAGLTPASDLHVRLSGGSTWTGSSDIITSMVLEGTSWWSLRGDAQVGSLEVRNSVVSLSGGAGGAFNTLTVDGNLHSENAQFQFSGVLDGDAAAFDRLHVRGDSSGDAAIWVTNVGGLGSGTIEGIPLIQVDGASLAHYSLVGRVVAGSNEYFLHKGGVAGGEGNWYLRSLLPPAAPCEIDPSLPGCVPVDPVDPVDPILPPPVLRPEAGVYLANQSAAINMFSHRLNDRIGAVSLDEGRAAWARVGRQQADFSAVGGQLSIDGNTSVLQIGSDLVRRGNAAFGVMLGTGRADSSAVSDLTGYSAKGRVRGSAVGVYGTWLQAADGTQGAYIDAALQYGRFDNRVQGIGLAPEHYDSRVASASLEAGYTFNVWQGSASALYVQPQLQLGQVDFRADRHVESNGTVIDHADAGGLSGRLGVRVFGHGTAASNIVQPYLGVNWLRGSGTSTLQFDGDRLGADVPRNRYEVQAGAELKLGQRWGAWAGMSVQRGDRGYRNVGGQLGLRKAW